MNNRTIRIVNINTLTYNLRKYVYKLLSSSYSKKCNFFFEGSVKIIFITDNDGKTMIDSVTPIAVTCIEYDSVNLPLTEKTKNEKKDESETIICSTPKKSYYNKIEVVADDDNELFFKMLDEFPDLKKKIEDEKFKDRVNKINRRKKIGGIRK